MGINKTTPKQVLKLQGYTQLLRGAYVALYTMVEWLAYIDSIRSDKIDLSLDRVAVIANRLQLLPIIPTVITVGGTNGKGSTVAALENIYSKAGYSVGVFTSPILFKYNEYVRIKGQDASDLAFCTAFQKIEAVREQIKLTPFEWSTLAALLIFQTHDLDLILLEVGLGGRLDAVNMVDADVTVITSIDIDHTDLLGTTREAIAFEKAGIFRAHQPAVYGDNNPTQNLIDYASSLKTNLFLHGKDFCFAENETDWSWQYQHICYTHLPRNQLLTQNMANALMVVTLLQKKFPIIESQIRQGLQYINLPARMQIILGDITQIYDVAHNPAAIKLLASRLIAMKSNGKIRAVFSMLKDKDILQSINEIREVIDDWYVAPLTTPRAASKELLQSFFFQATIEPVKFFSSIKEAFAVAQQQAKANDKIIVFGSFHTVAETIQ